MAEGTNEQIPPSIFHRYVDEQEVPEMAERILEAAMRLFARKGYAATSVREIVQEAKVTNPMLYYYFTNKEGVFIRLIDLLFGIMDTMLDEALEQHQGVLGRLGSIVDTHINAVQDAPEALRFMYASIFGPIESRPLFDLAARTARSHMKIKRIFEDAINQGELQLHPGFDTDFLAHLFMGTLNHYLMSTMVISDAASASMTPSHVSITAQSKDQLIKLFFCGVGVIKQEQ